MSVASWYDRRRLRAVPGEQDRSCVGRSLDSNMRRVLFRSYAVLISSVDPDASKSAAGTVVVVVGGLLNLTLREISRSVEDKRGLLDGRRREGIHVRVRCTFSSGEFSRLSTFSPVAFWFGDVGVHRHLAVDGRGQNDGQNVSELPMRRCGFSAAEFQTPLLMQCLLHHIFAVSLALLFPHPQKIIAPISAGA